MLVFDETSQYFQVGQQGISLQTVATRDDSPAPDALMIYDSTGKKLTACNTLVFNNGNMCIGTSTGDARLQVQCANAADQVVARFTNGTADTVIRPGMRFAQSGTQWSTLDASPSGGTGFWKPVAMASGLAIGSDNTYGQTAPPTRGAIIEGNVGIATTNPTERLHVASGKILASAGQILAYTGDTAMVPAYSWGDDSNTGIYHPAADSIAFTNGGSERMRIDSAGNVGIGKTNPTVRLDVNGTLNATTLQQNGSNLSSILSGYATTSALSGYATTSSLSSYVTTTSLSSTLSSYASTSSVSGKLNTSGGSISGSLNVSGNLGVGTTNPQYKLDVIGTMRANGNKAYFEDGSTTGLFIDRQFGTFGAVLTANAYFFGAWTRQIGGAGVVQIDMHNGSSSGDPPYIDFNYAAAGGSANSSVSTTRMARIDAGGVDANVQLITPCFLGGGISFRNGSSISVGKIIYDDYGGNYGSGWKFWYNNNATVFISVWGILHVSQVRYDSLVQNSDRRLKENIKPITGALDNVIKLQGVSYALINDPKKETMFGCIAQDVQEVFPELVCKNEHDPEGIMQLNYVKMIPLLLESIKEIKQQFDDYRTQTDARIKALEERLGIVG
jgi:hypothetical protein